MSSLQSIIKILKREIKSNYFSLQVNTFNRDQFGHLRCSVLFFNIEKKNFSLANNIIGFYLNMVFHIKLSSILLQKRQQKPPITAPASFT